MKSIHKYPLATAELQFIGLPAGAKILTVQLQHGQPCVWAEVDTAPGSYVRRAFHIVGTGCPMPAADVEYVATVQQGPFVWHVYVAPEGQQ